MGKPSRKLGEVDDVLEHVVGYRRTADLVSAKISLAGGDRPRAGCYTPALQTGVTRRMSVDRDTVRRIAHLARIKIPDAEVDGLQSELNAILAFVETLSEIDAANVEPMTSVMPMPLKKRADIVDDGGIAGDIMANAPVSEDHFFMVPKVIE